MKKYVITYDIGTTGIKTCLIEIEDSMRILSSLALPPAAMMKMHNTANFMVALHLKSCLFLWLYSTVSTSYHLLRHGKKILSSFL